jgi:hypothetical protein
MLEYCPEKIYIMVLINVKSAFISEKNVLLKIFIPTSGFCSLLFFSYMFFLLFIFHLKRSNLFLKNVSRLLSNNTCAVAKLNCTNCP